MASALLTTGKAAQLCSVKPDTVLKWIKRGVLPATRTAGGHYRLDEDDVLQVLCQDDCPAARAGGTALCSRPMRCWEYMSQGPGTECRECVVYKVHASWCFRMTSVVKGAGPAKRFCSGLCQDCPYYRRVHGLETNVLVVSQDEVLIHDLARRDNGSLAFRFARRGYDASAIITVFRPAYIVIDEAILEELGVALLDALATDSRTMGARIVVAIRKGAMGLRIHNRAVYATIQEPFDADEIVGLINQIPVEGIEAEAVKG